MKNRLMFFTGTGVHPTYHRTMVVQTRERQVDLSSREKNRIYVFECIKYLKLKLREQEIS